MPTLRAAAMEQTLESAFLLAASDAALPELWLRRAEQLRNSPSVAFIAAVGSVLLAKATDPTIDAFVIQKREGSAGAFSLRGPATVLGMNRHAYGYDIGSTSDHDPINHGTLIGSTRWDLALDRIEAGHKAFFQVILQWLRDVNDLTQDQAVAALAAYVRVRRALVASSPASRLPPTLPQAPALSDLVDVIEGFSSADPENGARGMALVAAAYRAAGLEAALPSRNDPRRIDVPVSRDGALVLACEVKQQATSEAVADTLASDAVQHGARRALLVVLRPGSLLRFNRASVIQRAEREHGVVLRICEGVRQLLHEALIAGPSDVDAFCSALPRAYADALREIRASESGMEIWVAISARWMK